MSAPRVMHVFSSIARGGAEMRTVEIMRALEPSAAREVVTLSVLAAAQASLDGARGAA